MSDPVLEMLVALRGGAPEKCDFCGHVFKNDDQIIPEEAGAWACRGCLDRWEKEDANKS